MSVLRTKNRISVLKPHTPLSMHYEVHLNVLPLFGPAPSSHTQNSVCSLDEFATNSIILPLL